MSVALARRAPYPVRAQQRRCDKCGKLVSRAAYACRRCGKSQRVQPRTVLLALGACLMAGMFAVAGGSGLVSPSRSVEAAEVVRAPVERPAATARGGSEIAAAELWMAYSRDPAGADRRFRDRSLVVSGVVQSVDRDFGGDVVIRLATGDAFDTVNATLATRNDPALGSVAKGRSASLLCVGRSALMGAPLLGSCYLR